MQRHRTINKNQCSYVISIAHLREEFRKMEFSLGSIKDLDIEIPTQCKESKMVKFPVIMKKMYKISLYSSLF